MSNAPPRDRRRKSRRRTRLGLRFAFGGRTWHATTVDVSANSAKILIPVRLPPGAVLVLQPDDPDVETALASPVRLVAKVVWSGRAPHGGSDRYRFVAGLLLKTAAAPDWEALVHFVRERLRSDSGTRSRRLLGGNPTVGFDDGATTAPQTDIRLLYLSDGMWQAGELLSAARDRLVVSARGSAPRLGSPISLRLRMRCDESLLTLVVEGTVPRAPVVEHESGAVRFDCIIKRYSRTDLFERLVAA